MNNTATQQKAIVSQLRHKWGLTSDDIGMIKDDVHLVAFPAGGTVFQQGDESDSVCLLLTGRLNVVISDGVEGSKTIGEVSAGEIFGELGAITGDRRSATIIAMRDSEVALIPVDAFQTLMKRNPATLLRLMTSISKRMVDFVTGTAPHGKASTKAIISLDPSIDLNDITQLATEACSRLKSVAVLDDSHNGQPSDHFFRLESSHERLIYRGQMPLDLWTRLCIRQADAIILVAKPDTPALSAEEIAQIKETFRGHRSDLVVLRDHSLGTQPSAGWLGSLPFHLRWNLDLQHQQDRSRFRRIVNETTTGIVMSGGGCRGFVHLGIMRALMEAGVEIDQMGGTSMGSLISAGLSTEWSIDEFLEKLKISFLPQNPLGDFTLPFHAIARGRRLSSLLHASFEERKIEDLRNPYFAVSASLTSSSEKIHSSDLVWRAVRASVSIPALVPPINIDNDVLVDGGLLNNFPIDIMRKRNRGPVIGIDVGDNDENFFIDEEVISSGPWKLVWERGPATVSDVLIRAMTIAGAANTIKQRELADYVIRPPVEGMGLLNWDKLEAYVQAGYDFAIRDNIADRVKSVIDNFDPARPGSGKSQEDFQNRLIP